MSRLMTGREGVVVAETATEGPSNKTVILMIALCMVIPLVLSAVFFMNQSLRLDEAQSLWQTSRSFSDIFMVVAGDVHVPFYHVLLRLWRLYVGDSVIYARLLSLLFFVLSIPVLYLLGSKVSTRRTALFATFLFSISPFMNWYGNEIRMYTLFTFFVILNQYFFVRLFKDEEQSDHVWAGYIITAVLGVFSHYFFLLNLAAEAVFYFLRRDLFAEGTFRRLVFAALVVVASVIPWVWYVVSQGTIGFQEPLLARPSSVDLFSTFGQFLFGFQNDNVNTFFLSLWPVVVILWLFSLGRTRRTNPETEYFLITLLLSIGFAFSWSYVVSPVFVSRYLIFTIPSFYLLLSELLELYSVRLKRVAEWSLVGVMAVTLFIEILNPTVPVKEDYKQVVSYLNSHVTTQDTIVLSAPFTIYPVQYYYHGSVPLETLPIWDQYAHGPIPNFNSGELPTEAQRVVGASQDIYLLLSYDQGYEKTVKDYFDSHYQMTAQQHFSKDLNLYVYRARYDTASSAVTTISS